MNMGNKKLKLESKSEQQNFLTKNNDLQNIDFRPLSTINTDKLLKNKKEIIESSESSYEEKQQNLTELHKLIEEDETDNKKSNIQSNMFEF